MDSFSKRAKTKTPAKSSMIEKEEDEHQNIRKTLERKLSMSIENQFRPEVSQILENKVQKSRQVSD